MPVLDWRPVSLLMCSNYLFAVDGLQRGPIGAPTIEQLPHKHREGGWFLLKVTANPSTITQYQLEHHRQVSRNIPKRL
jgi:hypothetical protein